MSEAPFAQFHELWNEVLKPALTEWRALTDEERAAWAESCPPQYRSAMTFFFVNRLYGAPQDDPPTST